MMAHNIEKHDIKWHFRAGTGRDEYRLIMYINGKRRKTWLDTTNKAEAIANAKQIINGIRAIQRRLDSDSLDSMKVKYRELKSPPFVKPPTANFYERKIKLFYQFLEELGVDCRADLEDVDMRDFITFLARRYTNESNINTHVRAAKTWLNIFGLDVQAKKEMRQIKEPATQLRIISEQEYHSLLAIANDNYKREIAFLWKSGCRAGEIYNLTWNRVNFKKNTMRIMGKGRERIVTIDHMLLLFADLKKHSRPGNPHVFPGQLVEKRSVSQMGKMFRTYSERIGLDPVILPQHFRQTAATRMLEAGVPEVIIRSQLGHVKINTTEKHYLQIGERLKAAAMDALK